MRTKLIRIGIRLVGPIVLLLVLWKMGDPRTLWRLLASVSLVPLLFACALNAPIIHFKVWRTQILCAIRGYRYGTRDAWRAMLPSLYLGMVTPGRVGDVLRVAYMREDLGAPRAEGLAIIVMDRFCDLYVLLGFVAAGIAHFAGVFVGRLGAITWLGVAATALLPLVFLVRGPADALSRALRGRFIGPHDSAERFLAALRGQLQPKLAWAVPLTVASFLLNYVQGWLAARAMGLELGYADVIFMMAITSLLGLLPISMSGVGVRELFMALVFPTLGYGREQGVAFGLLVFVVIYLSCSLAGLVAWQWSPPPIAAADDPGDKRLEDPKAKAISE